MRLQSSVLLSASTIGDAISQLKGRGIVDFSGVKADQNHDSKALYVRPGGVFQRLAARLSGERARSKHADQVCANLKTVLGGRVRNIDNLLKGVRAEIVKEGRLTGGFLADRLSDATSASG